MFFPRILAVRCPFVASVFSLRRALNALRTWGLSLSIIVLICSALGRASFVYGQNIKDTNNTVDQWSRSSSQVDPSTLGLSFEFTFGTYPGRGLNLPVSIRYSSKVWRHAFLGLTNHLTPKTYVGPI